MRIIPVSLRMANGFVLAHHRHNGPTAGHKFSIGVEEDGRLIGVAIAGRPVARTLDNGRNVEILRVCVLDGHKNACSKLYACCKGIAQLMGCERIFTYTLRKESHSFLRAVSAVLGKGSQPRSWDSPQRRRREQAIYREAKIRSGFSYSKSGVSTSPPVTGRHPQGEVE